MTFSRISIFCLSTTREREREREKINDFFSASQQLKLMFFKNRIANDIPLKLPKKHGKNGFAEVFKSLARYRSENKILFVLSK